MTGPPPNGNRRVLLVKRPRGVPQAADFAIDAVALPVPGEGEMHVRNLYLSVDPAQRGWANDSANYLDPVPLGAPMRALAVGRIEHSNVPGYAAGEHVYGWFGWQEHVLARPNDIITHINVPLAPLSAYAGPLGINGITALLALEQLGQPERGETLLVSTAAGAVGSIVGQLARRAGCRAIGLAGGPEKASLCTARFGFDVGIDYRAGALAEAIAAAAPQGVHIYFDNVGGETLDSVIRLMRPGGRIVQCGTASIAEWNPPPVGPRPEREVLMRRLSWNGFVVFDHLASFGDAIARLAGMIADGSLVYDEDVAEGIEAAPGALAEIYTGRNRGKKLIWVGER